MSDYFGRWRRVDYDRSSMIPHWETDVMNAPTGYVLRHTETRDGHPPVVAMLFVPAPPRDPLDYISIPVVPPVAQVPAARTKEET